VYAAVSLPASHSVIVNNPVDFFQVNPKLRPRPNTIDVVQFALTLAAAFGLAAWVYLIATRGSFWREFVRWEPDGHASKTVAPLPSVLAVIPARDEEA
jgi:hypothetical protein